MIRKHPYLWGGVVAILLALNLWHWLPAGEKSTASGRPWAGNGPALEFPLEAEKEDKKVGRDLFAFRSRAPVRPAASTSAKPAAQPAATPTPQNPKGMVTEIGEGYRLLGAVFQDGRGRALLGKGEEMLSVAPGDTVEGRWRVDRVGESEVHLTDQRTGNTLTLRIWDPQGAKP